jgi:YidC/Oxa1 family membrane protein insertase
MNPTPIGGDPGAQDTTRLMLTAVMMVTLYGVWSFFFAPKPDPTRYAADAGVLATDPAAPSDPSQPSPTQPTAPADPNAPAEPTLEAPPQPVGTPKLPEATFLVEGQVAGHKDNAVKTIEGGYQARITNQGGQIASFELPGYGDTHADIDPQLDGEHAKELPLYDLVNDDTPTGAMVALTARDGDVGLAERDSWEFIKREGHTVSLKRLTPAGVELVRTYQFDDGRFGFTHTLSMKNTTDAPKAVALDVTMHSLYGTGGGSMFAPNVMGDVAACRTAEDRFGFELGDLEDDGPGTAQGGVLYAAMSDQYFMKALLPEAADQAVGCRVTLYEPTVKERKDGSKQKGVALALQLPKTTLQPGEVKTFTQKGYFGPKQLQLLEQEGAQLDENIEFGIFGVLSKPILWLLIKLFDVTGNFGFAIILLTLIIKLLTFPLTQKSYTSMQQMKVLGPELKKLQEQYAHDRAALGQKQMDLYKEKGINPLAGCFPMLVQMPIWFALYRTLWNSVELYQKPFLGWITDLSQPDVFPWTGFAVLPFFVGALMLYQTTLSPPPQEQPQMKYVMWAMPIMFTLFMFSMPSGLSLYMITNSSLTMVQQLYIKRKFPAPEPEESK